MAADLDARVLSIKPGEPWVLLDDARAGGLGTLFTRPVDQLTAEWGEDVPDLLAALDRVAADGRIAAGWLAYEAGRPADGAERAAGPLGWFGVFDAGEAVSDVPARLPPAAGAAVVSLTPEVGRGDYDSMFDTVAEAIRAGTVYQANLTFGSAVAIAGGPLALYHRLRTRAAAAFCAIVWTGDRLILSFSPELFVERDGDRLTARPMKGTAARSGDPVVDRARAAALAADPKQMAENRMIVDLIRNDLSRVSAAGSVRVEDAFAVERYPTVHQMTATVRATASSGVGASDVLRALFPCGSITGAPKIAAQTLLGEIEAGPRGVYCGAIGRVGPGDRMALSVAIRTLELSPFAPDAGLHSARLGLGSGVVADSAAAAEWAECRLKGRFVEDAGPAFDLLETMRYDADTGLARLDRHLARLRDSAAALGFAFDRHAVRNELQAATFGRPMAARVRLLLSRSGAVAIELGPLPLPPADQWRAALAPMSVPATDLRRAHKTTDRAFYDRPRRASGADEVVFVAGGRITEGSITSVFVERGGRLLTPPLSTGLIPGVLRAELLADGRAVEHELSPGDLAKGFWLGNSVRGLTRARLTPVA